MIIHNNLMGKIVSHKITLKNKEQVADNTLAFTFTKPPGFQYAAGQHARLSVLQSSSNDKHESLSRFLSFASAPHEPDLTFVMRLSNSLFKQSLLDMKTGEQILLQTRQAGRRSAFSWSKHPDAYQPAVFIAGGVGVVPALSMIKDAIDRHLPTPIYLFYSNRCPEDAAYLTELENIDRENPTFFFIPTMTQLATSSHKWQGETGYISSDMIQAYIPNLITPIYYIAGKSSMVAAMDKIIGGFGVRKANIRIENFDNQKMQHMTNPTHRHGLVLNLKTIGLGLLVATAIVAHLSIAVSIQHGVKHIPSFGAIGLYAMLGLVLAVAGIKIGLLLNRLRKKN